MTSLTAGSMREGFLQSFPPGKLGRNQQERRTRDFSSRRGLESAGVLCVLQTSKPMNWQKISGICRRGFFQSFPNREARKKSARAEDERFFVEARFGKRRRTLCTPNLQTDELAENIRHLPQRIFSEFSQQGSSEEISKSGGREIFRRGEVWGTQEYFVYFKFPEPMDRRKSSGIRRR